MSTITEPSRMMRIREELKMLSPQELHLAETMVRSFQQDRQTEGENDRPHPKPGTVGRLKEICKGIRGMSDEEFHRLKRERILRNIVVTKDQTGYTDSGMIVFTPQDFLAYLDKQ